MWGFSEAKMGCAWRVATNLNANMTGSARPLETVPWRHLQTDAISSLILRGDLPHSSVRRLVMYIERDSRKTSPGKERQQSGNEYLSRCLDLLIRHMVQEVPRLLGKPSLTLGSLAAPLAGTWLFGHRPLFILAGVSLQSDTLPWMCSFSICFPSYFASVRWLRQEPAEGYVGVSSMVNGWFWKISKRKAF